jgi:hypothetical protein
LQDRGGRAGGELTAGLRAHSCSVHPGVASLRSEAVHSATLRKELPMKKTLARWIALAVVLAFPVGVFAQTAQTKEKKSESKSTESKSTTNPVTGTQTQSTETKMESNVDGKKTTSKKKRTKKVGKKKTSDKTEIKTETKQK